MATSVAHAPRKQRKTGEGPYYIFHPSFEEPDALARHQPPPDDYGQEKALGYMPDDVTRAWTRRMHYAAYRIATARTAAVRARWQHHYHACRDAVVMGNRKLIYRAVRRWGGGSQFADDMIGECQLVLIHAVAAYNPWLGVRFSTYAFTCLMRALSRMSQRLASDRLAHSLPLDALSEGEPRDLAQDEVPSPSVERLDEYLREGHTLLTPREKIILIRRFCLDEEHGEVGTLEQVGLELGLSKERVRQVQASALCKLRKAMLEGTPTS